MPLIVRGRVPAGQVVTKITANVDLAPTWAALAGAAAPGFVDGRSLAPLLTGITPAVWRKALLLEHGGPRLTPASSDPLLEPQHAFDVQAASTGGAQIFAGLRTAVRTYVEYDTGERAPYELQAEPRQLDNVYFTADPALTTRLSSWLGTLRQVAGATLRAAEENSP